MRILANGTLPTNANPEHASCSFPCFCVLPQGRMIASFKGSPVKDVLPGERVWLCMSDDGGATWSKPYSPIPATYESGGRIGSFRCGYCTSLGDSRILLLTNLVFHQNKDIPYFNVHTDGLLDTEIFGAISDDMGCSFGPLFRIDTSPYSQPTPLTGPALQLPDGRLMCQFELNKTYNDTVPWVHASMACFSSDGGASWQTPVEITRKPGLFYWDQRPAVMCDGRILNLFWSFDGEQAVYLNIHASESLDGGSTWKPVWDTGLPGQPGAPVDIGNGRVAAIYIDRRVQPTINLRISYDSAHSFDKSHLQIYSTALPKPQSKKSAMRDAWSEMDAFSVGHPGLIKLQDGSLFAFYYAGPHANRTDIHWAKIGLL